MQQEHALAGKVFPYSFFLDVSLGVSGQCIGIKEPVSCPKMFTGFLLNPVMSLYFF